MVKVITTGRTDLENFFSKGSILQNIQRSHHPFLAFSIFNDTVEVKIFKKVKNLVYSALSNDTKIMVQWEGRWRSDFFHFDLGKLREFYGKKYNINIEKIIEEEKRERERTRFLYSDKMFDLYSRFQKETGKRAIWSGKQTKAFKEKENLTEFNDNDNQYTLMKTTPSVFKDHLFQQGKGYRSRFYLCYDCMKSSETRIKLILKNKRWLIKQDFIYFRGGDVRTNSYWFTLEIDVYGYKCIYNKKTRTLVSEEMWKNNEIMKEEYKSFLDSVIDEIWVILT